MFTVLSNTEKTGRFNEPSEYTTPQRTRPGLYGTSIVQDLPMG